MTDIILTPTELDCLRILAGWRQNGKGVEGTFAAQGSDDSRYRQEASLDCNFMGIAGEYAIAKSLNGYLDVMPSPLGDKNKADVVIGPKGALRVAVKTTKYNPPILKISHLKEINDATHIALCYFDPPLIRIQWIKTKEFFMENHYKQDFGYGERMCLGAEQ